MKGSPLLGISVAIGSQIQTHPWDWKADKFTRTKQQSKLTNLRDIGVLSSSGRCCSRARTMQFAMMVARIMYSKGVEDKVKE